MQEQAAARRPFAYRAGFFATRKLAGFIVETTISKPFKLVLSNAHLAS